MYGFKKVSFWFLVVCIIRATAGKDESDLNLSQVFRTPKDFSRVNFDHFEILERNNFDPTHTSQVESENNEEQQFTNNPKSVANAQVMLRFGGDDIHGKNRIDASDMAKPKSHFHIKPSHHEHNHHLLHNDMRFSPNYPPYPTHPYFPPPSPYNYPFVPPPPYYYPGSYYPQRPCSYELHNGQWLPANESKTSKDQSISTEDDFLEKKERKEYVITNENPPKIYPVEDLSDDEIPKAKCKNCTKKVYIPRDPHHVEENREENNDNNDIRHNPVVESAIYLAPVTKEYVWTPSESPKSDISENPHREEKPIDFTSVTKEYIRKNTPIWIPSDSEKSDISHERSRDPIWIPSDSEQPQISREEKPINFKPVIKKYIDNNIEIPTDSPPAPKKYIVKDGHVWIPLDFHQSEIRRHSSGQESPIHLPDLTEEDFWLPSKSQNNIHLNHEEKPFSMPEKNREYIRTDKSVWLPSDSKQPQISNVPAEGEKPELIPSDSEQPQISREEKPINFKPVIKKYIDNNIEIPTDSPPAPKKYIVKDGHVWIPLDFHQSEIRRHSSGQESPIHLPDLTKEDFWLPSKSQNNIHLNHEEKPFSMPEKNREYIRTDKSVWLPSDSKQPQISNVPAEGEKPELIPSDSEQSKTKPIPAEKEKRIDIPAVNEYNFEKNTPVWIPSDSLRHDGKQEVTHENESFSGTEKPLVFTATSDKESTSSSHEKNKNERIPSTIEEKPIVLGDISKINPSSSYPVEEEKPISLPKINNDQPSSPHPVSEEIPIIIPPVDKNDMIMIAPTHEEKPVLIPSIPYKSVPYYPEYTDAWFSEVGPEKHFIDEVWLNKSLVPSHCQKCGQKPKLLVSYPIFQEPRRYLDTIWVGGCPCCQRKGFCDCCRSYRNPNVPFGERFPADVDSLHQVMNLKNPYGSIQYNPSSYSAGYSSSLAAGYSAEISQIGNQKPKVNLDGYRSSCGSGYYSDPSRDIYYKEPTLLDVVRTPNPYRPVLEHTQIEHPQLYKVVRKYNIVPKQVTPLVVTDLVPTNVFFCNQHKNPKRCKTTCHREYVPARNVIQMVPTSQFVPCRSSQEERAKSIDY